MIELDLEQENAALHCRVEELEVEVAELRNQIVSLTRKMRLAEVYEEGFNAGRYRPAAPHWIELHNPYLREH